MVGISLTFVGGLLVGGLELRAWFQCLVWQWLVWIVLFGVCCIWLLSICWLLGCLDLIISVGYFLGCYLLLDCCGYVNCCFV